MGTSYIMPGGTLSQEVGLPYPFEPFAVGLVEDMKKLDKHHLSQSAVSHLSLRGEKIARENRFELIERNA